MSNIKRFVGSNKNILIASVVAALLLAVYKFLSQVSQFVAFGLMTVLPFLSVMYIFIPWIFVVVICVIIALIFSLMKLRSTLFIACSGFAISFALVSLLVAMMESQLYFEVAFSVLLTYLIFVIVSLIALKLNINRVASVVIGIGLLSLSIYFTPILTHPIEAQRYTIRAENMFDTAVDDLSFRPYYPTYRSSLYPTSSPKLNGYIDSAYSNETVTFLLGKAQVKQGAYLDNQDRIMNFENNCTIYKLWFALEDGSGIKQRDVTHSLDNPQKCNLIRTTPTGKKVYFSESGQNVWFYVELSQTNFIIQFDDINSETYDPSKLDEILKIIDSLQPLDKSRIEDGKSYGFGFS